MEEVVLVKKKSKKCIKDKLTQAAELYDEVKKEADAIKETLLEVNGVPNVRHPDKRKASLSRD